MARGVDKASAMSAEPASFLVQATLCVLCTLVGAFYPTMVDLSKTAMQREVIHTGRGVETRELRAFPFSPVSVVFLNDLLQLSIALVFVSRKTGLRSLWSDRGLLLQMLPLGAIYAIGELLTLRSVQKGSGPVYVVVANMKLVIAALMSRAFFGRRVAMPLVHWAELVLISFAAAAYIILEAGALGAKWQWEGAGLALLKSTLVAFTSVFCEHTYKSNPFHATLTLQAFWGLVTVVILISVSISGLAMPSLAEELQDENGMRSLFGSGSRHPLCDAAEHAQCLKSLASLRTPDVGIVSCICVTHRGWDRYTLLTVIADLSNAVSSALIFKQLSAVAKYVCRATSAVPMYIFYCTVGRSAWNWKTFATVVYLCVQVSSYTVHRQRAAQVDQDAAWTEQYANPHAKASGTGSNRGELRQRNVA